MSEIIKGPISDAGVWTGGDFEADLSWKYELTKSQCDELDQALRSAQKAGLSIPEITAADFPLTSLTDVTSRIADDLRSGRGFAVLKGFPVENYSHKELELIYWGICSHIGTGQTQNSDGNFIHYVTAGKQRPNQGSRGVGFPRESVLHVDLTDIVSLLCVRQAPDSPPSRLASSAHLYNELLKRAPDAMERLYQGFEWDRMGEHDAMELPTTGYKVPVFSFAEGQMSCRYNRVWMASATQRLGVEFSPEDLALLDLIDEIALESCFEFPFEDGDMQFCSNYTVLHGRAAHKLQSEEDRHRILMRIWLQMPEFRAFEDEAIIRYGVGQHGQLGWSTEQVLNGKNTTPRTRRRDGAVATRT